MLPDPHHLVPATINFISTGIVYHIEKQQFHTCIQFDSRYLANVQGGDTWVHLEKIFSLTAFLIPGNYEVIIIIVLFFIL